MRTSLVTALSDCCIDDSRRRHARRFLQGLSGDELQYIADYIGSCILEPALRADCSRRQLAEGITTFERCRAAASGFAPLETGRPEAVTDHDHKMILLLEYLCRSGLTRRSLVARAGHA